MKGNPYLAKSYVIDASEKLPWSIRARDFVMTIVIWSIYFYFMKDTISFVHDAAIWIAHGFDDVGQYPGLKTLPDIIAFIRMGAGFAALLIGWSYYNMLRYGRKKRRRPAIPIEIERIAKAYEIDTAEASAWQKASVLTMYHDAKGRLIKVTEE